MAWEWKQPVRPDVANGCYRRPNGEALEPAVKLIERVWRPRSDRPERNREMRRALCTYATARYRDQRILAADGVALPPSPDVSALVASKIWDRIEVLAAPAHLGDPARPIGTTVDLLVRFTADEALGVATIQTAPKELIRVDAVQAELGAAVAMLNDAHKLTVEKAFVLWVRDGRVEVELVGPDQALMFWCDAIDLDAWIREESKVRRLSDLN